MKTKTLKDRLHLMSDTYEAIGDIAGVTKQAVGNWVSRDSIPKNAAKKLAEHFSLPYEWVMYGKGDLDNEYIGGTPFKYVIHDGQVHQKPNLTLDEVNEKARAYFDENTKGLIEGFVFSDVREAAIRYYRQEPNLFREQYALEIADIILKSNANIELLLDLRTMLRHLPKN